MALGFGLALWSTPAWRDTAVAWAESRLRAAGLQRTGEVTQPHLRPWGTVLRIPTDGGVYWLKAPGPQTTFEIGLYQLFSEVCPERTLTALAADAEQGWILLPDGGPVLGDSAQGTALVEALEEALPRYARLQRELMPHVDRLLRTGVADMRAAGMPQRFEQALGVVGAYAERHGDEADRRAHHDIGAMRELFGSWCAELASSPVPASLDHGDLHPWNIFTSTASPGGRTAFYDWGDSVVTHPFASMLTALGVVRQFLGVTDEDPALHRVRDAYLGVFTDLAPPDALARDLELACRVAKVTRALTWDRSLQAQGYEEAGAFGRAPLESLKSLLDPSPFQLSA
ncbi:phosphotransferase [Actinoplanes siamensis]|uniref:Phosphotransferase n=1 Tax=Actinoplanes siamensis TaxID=1223317 RepID=A0A919TLC4_9ACTN|nr:phosphotransferase [Actinoplanes siamensis]GIF07026.1 phosphotransferase [Actinoplanes siamensis]